MVANAPTVDTYTKDDMTREYLKGYNDCKDVNGRSTGEWIRDKVAFYLECSECGCDIRDANTCFLTDEDALNFCPNCGAKMSS